MQESVATLIEYQDCIFGPILRDVKWKGQRITMPFMVFEENGVDPCDEVEVAYPKGSENKIKVPNFAVLVLDSLVGFHFVINASEGEIHDYNLGLKWLDLHFPGTVEKIGFLK